MKKFAVTIALANGTTVLREVQASDALDLYDKARAVAKEYPNFVGYQSKLIVTPGERQSRFSDRPGVAREAYPQPTFPFAPGVIQRAPDGASIDVPDEWFALSKADTAKIVAMVVVLAIVATCLVRWWHVTH